MADTWFLVGEACHDGGCVVLRMDRATLPEATVVVGPCPRATAEARCAELRRQHAEEMSRG